MARALVVQHLEPEGSYCIAEALRAADVGVQVARADRGDVLPSVEELDALVVMGGPMSADSDEGFPSRRAEIALLADAVARGVPTLGVCLGAQLLAEATGGTTVRGDGPEIGWGPVTLSAGAAADTLLAGAPAELPVLHWHADTIRLPERAVLLASSRRYPSQAFRVGSAAWGLQFHLEVTRAAVKAFLDAFPGDAAAARGGAEAILEQTGPALTELEPVRARILERFAGLVSSCVRRP